MIGVKSNVAGASGSRGIRRFSPANVLYPASAICMLIGFFLLSRVLDPEPGSLTNLLVLFGVQNVYEALLIGGGLFLINRLNVNEDGSLLLLLALVFLGDASFLLMDVLTAHPDALPILIGGAGALLLLKMAALMRFLPSNLHGAVPLWSGFLYLCLYGLSGFLVLGTANRWLSGGLMTYFWWGPGLLLVLVGTIPARGGSISSEDDDRSDPVGIFQKLLKPGLTWIPLLLLFLHLIIGHWILHIPLHLSNFSPLFLGAAGFLVIRRPSFLSRTGTMTWTTLLCLIALIGSTFYPESSEIALNWLPNQLLTPFRLSLFGTALVFSGVAFTLDYLTHLFFSVFFFCLSTVSDSPGSTVETFYSLWPKTTRTWGILTVAIGFVLFAAGFVTSIYRSNQES